MGDAGHSGARSVLEGTFALLTAMERLGQAGVTRLAEESGLPKATAHRLLQQLADLGAVERQRQSLYRMGPRMFRLGQAWQPCPGLGAVFPWATAAGKLLVAEARPNGRGAAGRVRHQCRTAGGAFR